jgi:hypothetical protein
MAMFDIFKKKGTLTGEVVLHGLPPHKMYSVTVTFFRVVSASAPPPFGGDPSVDQYPDDDESVKEADEPDDKPLRFRAQRSVGFYYLAVGVIAYLERGDRMFAQVERFFPMTSPCEITAAGEQHVQLKVWWPDIPFDELHSYGTIHPQKS